MVYGLVWLYQNNKTWYQLVDNFLLILKDRLFLTQGNILLRIVKLKPQNRK